MKARKQNGFGVIEIILIVAVIGIAATLLWFFVTKNTADTPQQTEAAPPIPAADILQPHAVTDHIREHLAEANTILDIDKNNDPKKGEVSISLEDASPPYQVDGYDYYVSYKGGSSLFVTTPGALDTKTPPSKTDVDLRHQIAHIYHELGLESSETRSENGKLSTNVYTGKGLICTIETDSAQISGSTAACGTIASYATAARTVKPISDIIEYDSDSTIFSNIAIKPSTSDDYSIASVSVGSTHGGGGVALFWKHGTEEWNLFRYTQNTLSCASYTTPELRTAFDGEACFDEATNKMSKVARPKHNK